MRKVNYLHQGGYVLTYTKEVMFSSLFVCLLATLNKNFRMDLHKIFKEGWQLANKQMVKFWWRSESQIRIATLVKRALAEVCTVPVLLATDIVNTHKDRD